ncbi:hypothetical protein RI129_013199 [Pyrocoelia pectoralis]|uniref:DDE Tnp4 domain-containing protein n=1 Tax=Pyrocoelia pectoralis TaxID=417401 RepID=A0AAN7V2J4_9COLE
MPTTQEEMQHNSRQFYEISHFPKCIGALDCTHVKIQSPGGPEPEIYRNRKSIFSMNVQGICDASCKFENVVCRWAGSVHDSTIFNNSNIRTQFENGRYASYCLVGDSGYGIKPFLITPLANPGTAAEHLFNEAQIRTRNPIERCFGIWKRRFPILAFGIRLQLRKVESVVIATAVLHNIACLLNEDLPPITEEEEAAIDFVNNIEVGRVRDAAGLNQNNRVRNQLIHDYFNQLL